MECSEKWRNNLNSINFPNYAELSSECIHKMFFTNIPEREMLLNYIITRICGECKTKEDHSRDDIIDFFESTGLIKHASITTFVDVTCSVKKQENMWNVIFAFTRMSICANEKGFVHDHVGIHTKHADLFSKHKFEDFDDKLHSMLSTSGHKAKGESSFNPANLEYMESISDVANFDQELKELLEDPEMQKIIEKGERKKQLEEWMKDDAGMEDEIKGNQKADIQNHRATVTEPITTD